MTLRLTFSSASIPSNPVHIAGKEIKVDEIVLKVNQQAPSICANGLGSIAENKKSVHWQDLPQNWVERREELEEESVKVFMDQEGYQIIQMCQERPSWVKIQPAKCDYVKEIMYAKETPWDQISNRVLLRCYRRLARKQIYVFQDYSPAFRSEVNLYLDLYKSELIKRNILSSEE
jgi:hypothetical protein